MSEESYIKAPCCECNGRVSLPLDAVGVDFNCPHCGAGLQMLLKHVCEHCNGKLSFDNNPDAIGTEVECGHCHKQTVLSPSTFSTEDLEESVISPESGNENAGTEEEAEPRAARVRHRTARSDSLPVAARRGQPPLPKPGDEHELRPLQGRQHVRRLRVRRRGALRARRRAVRRRHDVARGRPALQAHFC